MRLEGNILHNGSIIPAEIEFGKTIKSVRETRREFNHYILPGFIDAHIHIESTMLTPRRFAEAAIPHGTTAIVTDPHEIANVLGIPGIRFMVRKTHPLKIFMTAPSCVPATPFETSGAKLGAREVREVLGWRQCVALGEMMNYPGVINDDKEVWEKIDAAKKLGKPIDGHAPLLSGEDLKKYIGAGISTDHECTNFSEAQEKANLGMTIMVREGSASHNMADLIGVSGKKFLVSDDLHPEDLLLGHTDVLLRKAVGLGVDAVEAVAMVTEYPASHYSLNCGRIEEGRDADFTLVENLRHFSVSSVFIDGEKVAKNGKPLFKTKPGKIRPTFHIRKKRPEDFIIPSPKRREKVKVIRIIENSLLTEKEESELHCKNGEILPDVERDINYLFVVDRHRGKNIGKGFVAGLGLHEGALASSVAHDSHNIVIAGTSREYVCRAVNAIIDMGGGLFFVTRREKVRLSLPIAGLMSDEPAKKVARQNEKIKKAVQEAGVGISSPFMALSFLSLLVLPRLKLSDKGLFDVEKFTFLPLTETLF